MSFVETAFDVGLPQEEQALAKSVFAAIVHSGSIRLESDGSMYLLPSKAARNIVTMLNMMADGEDVCFAPVRSELTVQQARKFLRMSERRLNDLMNNDRIAYRQVGGERMILRDSLLEFEQERERRHALLDEIAQMSQEMGLYDD